MVELLEEGMDTAEDEVGGLVLAPEIPPTLDDSFVVAENFKASASASNPGDRLDEELKTECLCPADVSEPIKRLPTGDETPGSPFLTDNDGNPDA